MSDPKHDNRSEVTWFVGAAYGGVADQLPRFLAEGIWENGYEDKYLDLVRSMRPGDRIAVKSSYTRKRDLPFDNRDQTVSVMAIKAIGTITENLNDGRHVRVNWTKVEPVREWYFYTYRGTVRRVTPGEWRSDGLIAFAFDGKPQDIDRFRNAPYLRERFGDAEPDKRRFGWTKFYEAIADKLLVYRNDRAPLVARIREIAQRVEGVGNLAGDKYADGGAGFVRDICPFTTMGLFNRGLKDANRRAIAAELASFLGVDEPVPESFEAVPLLNNQKSWYFPYEIERASDHVDSLWTVFAAAIDYAAAKDDASQQEFAVAFDAAASRPLVGWNLTIGLYWCRPWSYPSLDRNSQVYIGNKLRVDIGRHGAKRRCSAADYLSVMDALEPHFGEPTYPVHSYPELSLEAWRYKPPASETEDVEPQQPDTDEELDAHDELRPLTMQASASATPYAVDDILKDGCFLARLEIERILDQLRVKKNLILQGPPGTGKTWLAKRLGFALIGAKDESKLRAVQFHPNLSYEDFVRGWRPTADGKLSIADGVFMHSITAANREPLSRFVVVIEEINRGNPAQIFGELLTLLEAGKRTPNEALELCYPDQDGRRRPVHIPENLYVIGTMNIADRSLALVDLALRRRFAFVNLEPKLGASWREWVVRQCAVDESLAAEIERRISTLNEQIAADARLGRQFRIGQSYVTPPNALEAGATKTWFLAIVDMEIGPLLEEYWFDAPGEAQKAIERLKQDW